VPEPMTMKFVDLRHTVVSHLAIAARIGSCVGLRQSSYMLQQVLAICFGGHRTEP